MDAVARSLYLWRYGATQSAFPAPQDGRLTQQGNRLYLHVFAWPLGTFFLENLVDRVEYAQFLHDGSEVRFQ